MTADDAAQYERWATEHYENFTVGSWLLPRHLRRHVRLLYAYCRYVDDLGDEAPGDRLGLLTEFESDVQRCFTGTPQHPLLQAFQPTIEEFALPMEPLVKLIRANKMDQTITRYETYDDLLTYCDHSANPVGHLFLSLLGYTDDERKRLSDATCTGLQLANFWQDVAKDYSKGRIYIPLADMQQFGVTEQDIARGKPTEAFRALLAFECERARELFYEGLPLTNMVHGVAKVDIRLFSYGGLTVLDGLKANEYDVFSHRPTVSKWRKAKLFVQALGWFATVGLQRSTRGDGQ